MDLVKDIKLELRLQEQRDGDTYGKIVRKYYMVLLFDDILVGRLDIDGEFVSKKSGEKTFRIKWNINDCRYTFENYLDSQIPRELVDTVEEIVILKCLKYKSTDTKGYVTPNEVFNGCIDKVMDIFKTNRMY